MHDNDTPDDSITNDSITNDSITDDAALEALDDRANDDPTNDDPTNDDPTNDDDQSDLGDTSGTTSSPLDEPPLDQPPSHEPPPPGPPIRRLRRADASSGPGVAAGIARYLGVETGLIKAAFVVATFFGGLGIFAYIAAWAFIPPEHHPDPRPVVINGGVAAIVIGTLALTGAASVAFGAGGAAGSLLAPALLIGIGFYLLDQRSSPQVITNEHHQPRTRPSWIPPLTTTPLTTTPMSSRSTAPTSTFDSSPPADSYDDQANTPPQWGSIWTDAAVAQPPAARRPPVTAVTMALLAATVAVLIALDQFTSVDVSVPQMFGAALTIILVGILVSLFVGRALGLWFAGFVALIGLAISPFAVAISVNGVGSQTHTVLGGSELLATYDLGVGELILDLRDAEFENDAATSLDVKAGSIVVHVPADTTLDLRARTRAGEIIVPSAIDAGSNGHWCEPDGTTTASSGGDTRVNRLFEAREGAAVLTLDADVRFGQIEIVCS